MRRAAGLLITTLSVVVIGALTLMPQGPTRAGVGHWCVVCGTASAADVVANVLLFGPLGVGLGLLGVSWWRATVLAAAFSLAIETTQFLAVPGRFATLSDLVTNTLGGSLAAFVTLRRGFWFRPRPAVASGFAVLSALAFIGALWAGAFLLYRPDDPLPWSPRQVVLPPPMPFGAASFGGWFAGRVQRATVGGYTFVHGGTGPVTIVAPARRAVEAEVQIVGRDTRGVLIPVLYIVSTLHPHAPWLILGQHGPRYDVEVGHRARMLGLRQPSVSIRRSDDLEGQREAPFTLRTTVSGDRLTLQFFQGAERRRSTVRIAPTYGWALLSPIPALDAPEAGLATAAWLAVLALPLGYFVRWAGVGTRRAAAVACAGIAATLAVGFVAIPLAFGFAVARPFEWITALAGIALGAAAVEGVRRLR